MMCRVPSSLQPIFGGGGALKDRLHSEEEVAAALQRYIEANEELQVGPLRVEGEIVAKLQPFVRMQTSSCITGYFRTIRAVTVEVMLSMHALSSIKPTYCQCCPCALQS